MNFNCCTVYNVYHIHQLVLLQSVPQMSSVAHKNTKCHDSINTNDIIIKDQYIQCTALRSCKNEVYLCSTTSTAHRQTGRCGAGWLHVSTAAGAATFSHQKTADESQRKAANCQTYAAASEIFSQHSSLHRTHSTKYASKLYFVMDICHTIIVYYAKAAQQYTIQYKIQNKTMQNHSIQNNSGLSSSIIMQEAAHKRKNNK